jgi:hypothetical protein
MKIATCISILFLLTTFPLCANSFPAPPDMQVTKRFSIPNYIRQPTPPFYMDQGIRNLETISRRDWLAKDSLFYAFELALLNDFEKAFAYFSKLDTDTISAETALRLYQLTLRKNKRYSRLKLSIGRNTEPNSHELRIRLRMIDVRKMVNERVFRVQDDLLFPELKDTIHYSYLTDNSYYDKVLIPLAESYRNALEHDIYFTDERDRVLSMAYEELGDFLNKHLYITNAYKCYMIARNFDRNNSSVAKKIRETRRELDRQNFLHPSVREFLGKVRDDHYTYKTYVELEKTISVNDENYITLDELLQFEKNPDRIPGVNSELVTILVLLLTLIGVVLFVRSK